MKQLGPVIVGAFGAVGALLVLLVSGLLNFAASSGHWDATDLLMDLAARQSVTARSTGIDVPPLDDPNMIRRGAGHYEMVCAACHGSPGRPPEAFATDLTPKPPLLVEQMQNWRPAARIFWTVQHGIKRTGMPAWPSQRRPDEVWDMVAFLRAMPGLTADQYRALAGDSRASVTCVNCHGDDGRGFEGAFPHLDLQSPDYLADALTAFRDGTRASGTMIAAASGLTDAQIADLAAYYGRAAPEAPTGTSAGETIARLGILERDIPACDSCHGANGRKDYPRLAGQNADYIVRQLKLFAELGADRGGKYVQVMSEVVRRMKPEEMEAVAAFYSRSGD